MIEECAGASTTDAAESAAGVLYTWARTCYKILQKWPPLLQPHVLLQLNRPILSVARDITFD